MNSCSNNDIYQDIPLKAFCILLVILYLVLPQFVLPSFGVEAVSAVGVVDARFDRVGEFLKNMKIPFKRISYKDLEKAETYTKYRVIFFPCGIGHPVETNVDVLAQGRRIQSVKLKDNYYTIDLKKVYSYISDFIDMGGSAYFSDFSYTFLQGACQCFNFFDNFANMGLGGHLNMELFGDLKSFVKSNTESKYMYHSGWVVMESIKNAEIIINGYFDTPRGKRNGPIAGILHWGKGEALYTSYHNDSRMDELMRFFILRVLFRNLYDQMSEQVNDFGQKIRGRIVDAIMPGEYRRSYSFTLSPGANTFYFHNETTYFQIDVFDKQGNFIISRDRLQRSFSVDLNSDIKQDYTVRVFPPVTGKKINPFVLVHAVGERRNPQMLKIILIIFSSIAVIILVFLLKKYMVGMKSSRKARKIYWSK